MRLLRLAVATGALAAAGFSATPATAFTCNGAPIDTDPVGVPGILTVQVCSEGARIIPGPNVTSAGQVGVTVLGTEYCVGYERITVGTSGIHVSGTPVNTYCP